MVVKRHGFLGLARNVYVQLHYAYLAIFRSALGKGETEPKPKPEIKQKAAIKLSQWRELFNGIWSFNDKSDNQQKTPINQSQFIPHFNLSDFKAADS